MISNEVRKYCRKIYHHLIENYEEAINSEEMYKSIIQKITNCPPMLTGKMDSYITSPIRIRMLINRCYDETLYKAVRIEKYPSDYGYDYVWKIEKTAKAGVKFNLNKRN